MPVSNAFLFPDEGLSLESRETLKSPQIRLLRRVLMGLIGKFMHLRLYVVPLISLPHLLPSLMLVFLSSFKDCFLRGTLLASSWIKDPNSYAHA